jgi:hypothetical protein
MPWHGFTQAVHDSCVHANIWSWKHHVVLPTAMQNTNQVEHV